MRRRRWGETGLFVFVFLMVFGVICSNTAAEMTSSFHGTFESNFILRDADGLQHGFFDEAYGVQQRNVLKFDVDINPGIEWGPFRVEKVHLTYRGAYDSIFDLAAHRYDIKENLGASRFDYGLRDIRFENDLREAFIDFAYQGDSGTGFFRPGRQIVSWGEGMLETLNDVINPPDQSYAMFFQSPDDVKTPLWMGRINYSIPRMPGFGLNFDLLWVPDIRPTQFAPLDSVVGNRSVGLQAPYMRILPFVDFKGLNVRQDVPTSENEYGAKVSADIGNRFKASLVYFRDVVNEPAVYVHLTSQPTAFLTHPKQHVYGGFFGYQLIAFGTEAIIRGEITHYTAYPISLVSADNIRKIEDGQLVLQTFLLKPMTKFTLAVDKDLRIPWLSKDLTKVSVEWLHKVINEWNNRLDNRWYISGTTKTRQDRRHIREQDVILCNIQTYWLASKLNPSFTAGYNPGKHGEGGTAMIAPSIKYYIQPGIYCDLKLQAFFGDARASWGFANLINYASDATFKIGYEW